jgi:hypothetical protein
MLTQLANVNVTPPNYDVQQLRHLLKGDCARDLFPPSEAQEHTGLVQDVVDLANVCICVRIRLQCMRCTCVCVCMYVCTYVICM